MDKTKKAGTITLSVIIAAMAIFSAVLIGRYVKNKDANVAALPAAVATKNGEKLFDADKQTMVKEEVTISTEVIRDGLHNIGTLVTQEYYFTQAETYEKTVTFMGIPSVAKMIYSYDGVVYAGVECSEIVVDKSDEEKVIYVTVPKAKVTSVDIDYDSFKEFESKQGLWSKINLSDVNKSLQEFKSTAEANAEEKGVLRSADKNAETIIERFIRALVDNSEYTITFIHK